MILRHPHANTFGHNGIHNGISKACLCFLRHATRFSSEQHQPITRRMHCTSKSSLSAIAPPRLRSEYFCANDVSMEGQATARSWSLQPSVTSILPNTQSILTPPPPHSQQPNNSQCPPKPEPFTLPRNASTTLTVRARSLPKSSLRRLISTLLSLSKPRLSILVVLTATASYSLYPTPILLSPALLSTPSLSTLTLLYLTTGTAFCAASANTFNMLYEPKWDALMSRTRMRPLVRNLISPGGALVYAIVAGIAGVGALYYGVNPTVAFLGGLNIALYAAVYTPLKRITILNTWIGALVGAIPPLMGWAAAAGQYAATGHWQELLLGEQNMGAWLLAALLFAWQLSHFMSLSWTIRSEYKAAGYRMLCWTNPSRNARVALRYSLVLMPVCVGLSAIGVTEWSFAAVSAPVNIWLAREAGRFWWFEGAKGSARGLFWASVWYLPAVLVLALVEKRGLWARVLEALGWGVDDKEEGEWIEEGMEAAGFLSRDKGVPLSLGGKDASAVPPR